MFVEERPRESATTYCGIHLTKNLGKYLGVLSSTKGLANKILITLLIKSRIGLLVGCLTLLCSLARLPLWCNLSHLLSPVIICKLCFFLLLCVREGLIEISCGVTLLRKRKYTLSTGIRFVRAKIVVVWVSKKARDQNLALLSKIGWKVSNQDESLWAHILRDKYLSNHTISSWPRNRPASHVWRIIVDTRHVLEKEVKWIIGDMIKL